MRFRNIPVFPEPIVPDNLANHPRYGRAPRASSQEIPLDANGHWRYKKSNTFRSSAILADLSRQTEATVPYEFYVDVLENCVNCGLPFLFFAEEQKHWFEELGFGLDSWCVRCAGCRKEDQKLKRHFQHFSEGICRGSFEDDELVELIEAALFLWESGIIVKEEKLFRIRNLAMNQIPGHHATKLLDQKRSELLDK